MKTQLMKLNQYFSHAVETYTPGLWFPLTIVLFNSIIQILNTQFTYAQLDLSDIPRNIQTAMSVLGGSVVIGSSLIGWLLVSVTVFYWCELFYDIQGSFRNFFEIVGICHLVLLIGTLICTLSISFILGDDPSQLKIHELDTEKQLEVITEMLSPLKLISTISNIGFGLLLVGVVERLFHVKWLKAFYSVAVPYLIYWLLKNALKSVFL